MVLNTLQHLETDNAKINDSEVQKVINEMVVEGFELKSVVPLANSRVDYESDDQGNDVDGLVLSYTESLMLFFERES
ncbi:MAG: hypothetical protein HWD84_10485 [Flavobacteriaceae bacterium]|nr:hypothetical protein [Flavobacteriaceae bacterium]